MPPGRSLGRAFFFADPIDDSSNFDLNNLKSINLETISARTTCPSVIQLPRAPDKAMQNQFTNDGDAHIDRTTSAAICNAIGERLRRDIGSNDDALPSHLQTLIDRMRQQDEKR
jgi:hypothetical protein